MKILIALLIGFFFVAPMSAMAETPTWRDPVNETVNPELFFGTPVPSGDLEIYVDGQFADQIKVLVFQWTDGKKCFDFAHLRQHKKFKEIPCQ